jgi:hypothetical protein
MWTFQPFHVWQTYFSNKITPVMLYIAAQKAVTWLTLKVNVKLLKAQRGATTHPNCLKMASVHLARMMTLTGNAWLIVGLITQSNVLVHDCLTLF